MLTLDIGPGLSTHMQHREACIAAFLCRFPSPGLTTQRIARQFSVTALSENDCTGFLQRPSVAMKNSANAYHYSLLRRPLNQQTQRSVHACHCSIMNRQGSHLKQSSLPVHLAPIQYTMNIRFCMEIQVLHALSIQVLSVYQQVYNYLFIPNLCLYDTDIQETKH